MRASLWQSDGGGFGSLGGLLQYAPLLFVFAIFYFLLILPTQKRQKKQKEMLDSLSAGDRVVTTGGIRGTIVSVKEDTLILRIAPNDIRLEVVRSAVAAVDAPKESKEKD